MGYYLRSLSKRPEQMPLAELRTKLKISAPNAAISIEGGNESSWTQLLITVGDREVCELGCDLDEGPNCLLRDELSEFVAEIACARPQSAARWLERYLPQVRSIYAIRVLFGDDGGDWETISELQSAIHESSGGVFQADNEGFSNEDGYHILWQFPLDVTGPWRMAVLGPDEKWQRFEIDLGNAAHREAFWRGEVPSGIKST